MENIAIKHIKKPPFQKEFGTPEGVVETEFMA